MVRHQSRQGQLVRYDPPTKAQQRAISVAVAIAAKVINRSLKDDNALMRSISTAEEQRLGSKRIPVFAVSTNEYWALSLPYACNMSNLCATHDCLLTRSVAI